MITAEKLQRMSDAVDRVLKADEVETWGRIPFFDDMGYDPDETPRRIVIPTEPGESIEVPASNFLTDCTGVMPPDAV